MSRLATSDCHTSSLTRLQPLLSFKRKEKLQNKEKTQSTKMLALAKLVLLALVAILAFALTAEARELLDRYDDCYSKVSSLSPLPVCCSYAFL